MPPPERAKRAALVRHLNQVFIAYEIMLVVIYFWLVCVAYLLAI